MAKVMMKWFQVLALVSSLLVSSIVWSEEEVDEALGTSRPGYAAAIADAVVPDRNESTVTPLLP